MKDSNETDSTRQTITSCYAEYSALIIQRIKIRYYKMFEPCGSGRYIKVIDALASDHFIAADFSPLQNKPLSRQNVQEFAAVIASEAKQSSMSKAQIASVVPSSQRRYI